MLNNDGGIDLNDIDMVQEGGSIQFKVDPAMLIRVQNAAGLFLGAIHIHPVNISMFLIGNE